MEKLVFLPEVKKQVRKSTTRIYAAMATGKFPRPVRIGERRVAWLQSDLDAWLEALVAKRDADIEAREPDAV